MTRPPSPLGKTGEDLAVGFLKRNGYTVLERNFRCRGGEIDIVACEENTLCFVEVKSRTSQDYGSPEEAITRNKKRRMTHAALYYLVQKRVQDADWRFDVVTVLVSQGEPEIELIQGAFQPTRRIP